MTAIDRMARIARTAIDAAATTPKHRAGRPPFRQRLEGLVPRHSAVSINAHIAVGAAAGAAGVFGGAKFFPTPTDAKDERFDKLDWYRAASAAALGTGVLMFVITAGSQYGSDTRKLVPAGTLAAYSIGFGVGVEAGGLIGMPYVKDMEN